MKQTAQSTKKESVELVRRVGPKAADIERTKATFIRHLTKNGGVVSAALARSGLSRRTAYDTTKQMKNLQVTDEKHWRFLVMIYSPKLASVRSTGTW